MKLRIFIMSILVMAMCSSCKSKKNLIYFQDEPLEEGLSMSQPQQLVFKPDDLLTINVSALDIETVRPFNLPVVSNNASNLMNAQAGLQQQSYLVDYSGNIEFPVLGTIKVEGLTRQDLTKLLVDKIKTMANDPIVNIRLANFTITILGEVANPGTFTIPNERITILEALGFASDLTIYGERKNLLVIREVNGKKKFAQIDLTSINTINSPAYYLQQNDVIYVEPNKARIRASSFNPNNGILISAISLLATITAIFLANSN